MIIKHGDMWKSLLVYQEIYVTGNSVVKADGTLVMGRGAAKQAALRWPSLPRIFGERIADRPEYLLVPPSDDGPNVGLFQVKNHFAANADIELIKFSAMALAVRARLHPEWYFAVNFPGIGNGGLQYGEVSPIIEWILPDNVHVWLYATSRQLATAGLSE
jgi:hypothetical protein